MNWILFIVVYVLGWAALTRPLYHLSVEEYEPRTSAFFAMLMALVWPGWVLWFVLWKAWMEPKRIIPKRPCKGQHKAGCVDCEDERAQKAAA